MPKIARKLPQAKREAWNRSFPQYPQKKIPLTTVDPGFLASRTMTINFGCLSHSL
jgi:hypothetical protein